MPAADDRTADQAKAAIAAALGQIGFTLPGSITIRRTRCGKPRCACKADPPALHGPYIQWTRTVDGKTVTRTLTQAQYATTKRQERLRRLIKAIFDDSDGTYGYRRLAAQLARQGVVAGRELVRKLMRELGLVACQPRPWRPSTTEQGAAGPIPDLVNRDFSAEKPGQKMVGDITYIPTWQGWEYLATVIDCATRKVIGWAMGDNYKTPLITTAIEMAARNIDLPADAVFHSDRGSNYTSAEFGDTYASWFANARRLRTLAAELEALSLQEIARAEGWAKITPGTQAPPRTRPVRGPNHPKPPRTPGDQPA